MGAALGIALGLALLAGCSNTGTHTAEPAETPSALLGAAGDDPACKALMKVGAEQLEVYNQAMANIEAWSSQRSTDGTDDYAFDWQRNNKEPAAAWKLFGSVIGSLQKIWPTAQNADLKSTMKALARYGNTPAEIQANLREGTSDFDFHVNALSVLCPAPGL